MPDWVLGIGLIVLSLWVLYTIGKLALREEKNHKQHQTALEELHNRVKTIEQHNASYESSYFRPISKTKDN